MTYRTRGFVEVGPCKSGTFNNHIKWCRENLSGDSWEIKTSKYKVDISHTFEVIVSYIEFKTENDLIFYKMAFGINENSL